MRKSVELSLEIILLILFYSAIFMVLMRNEGQNQNVNTITAVYWVMSTLTTLGYGDIVFRSQIGRVYSISSPNRWMAPGNKFFLGGEAI